MYTSLNSAQAPVYWAAPMVNTGHEGKRLQGLKMLVLGRRLYSIITYLVARPNQFCSVAVI